MSDLNKYVKDWVSANCCDGEDRSDAHCDYHGLTSPELYELLDDLATDIIEIYEFEKVQKLEQEVKELKEWQSGVYSLSAYMVFHESMSHVYMGQAKGILAQRDNELIGCLVDRIINCREIELSQGDKDTIELIAEQLQEQE